MNILKEKDKKILFYLEIIAIAFLWAFMHGYKLGEIPAGLHIDEAGMAYDAFCLANWGVDRYLNPFPLYFYNLGGGQSAAYVYLCAFFIKIFGMDTYVFRIPALLFSFITIVFSSLIVNRCYGKNWALMNALLFCLLPYFTMQSRFGLDCNLMLGAATFCIWLTIKTLEKDKNSLYILTGIAWGLSLYTYVLSYLVFPIFLLFLFLWLIVCRAKRIRFENDAIKGKITLGKTVMLVFPMIIVSLPLIIMVLINVFDLNTIQTKYFTIYKLQDSRVEEFVPSQILRNILNVIRVVFTYDSAPFDAFPKYYTMYPISIPVCIFGFLYGIYRILTNWKKKVLNRETIIIQIMHFYFWAQVLVGSVHDGSSIYRMNGIYVSMLFLLVSGFYAIWKTIVWFWKKILLSYIVVGIILLIYAGCFFSFSHFYFNEYPNTIYSYYLFSARLNEVLNVFDTSIRTYKTYLDTYYLYYMIEKRVNPYLAPQFTDKEMNQYGDITFNSMHTTIPDDISQYDIYVISRWDTNTIELLSSYPFEHYWTNDYVVFYH